MKLGFFLERTTSLKIMGGLIEAALERGHEVVIFYQPNTNRSDKAYQNISISALPRFGSGEPALVECGENDIAHQVLQHNPDVFLSQEGYYRFSMKGRLDDLVQIREGGIKTASLTHFYEISGRTLEALDAFDMTFYISEFARDLHFALHLDGDQVEHEKKKSADRYAIVGSPMFDQIPHARAERVRHRYGIPPRKRVVLLMSPVILPATPWRMHVWRDSSKLSRSKTAIRNRKWEYLYEIWTGSTFRDTVLAIRDFCDRNEAVLVVKSRGKQHDPKYLINNADIYLDGHDDVFYPVFTTYQLLAVADLCITTLSMTALEAVIASVPVLNIYVPHLDKIRFPDEVHRHYLDIIETNRRVGPMNYPGCVWTIDRRRVVRWLHDKRLDGFSIDPEARAAYIEMYLGVSEQTSSQRILAVLQKMIEEQPTPAAQAA